MKTSAYGQLVVFSIFLLLGSTSCGNSAASGPAQGANSTSSPPVTSCDREQPLGCDTYASISGVDAGSKDMPWVTEKPLKMNFAMMNGTRTMVIVTPCNALNVPVTVTDSLITPDANSIAGGAKGCLGADGDHEEWVRKFLSHPITYSQAGMKYTLKNEIGTVEFKRDTTSG